MGERLTREQLKSANEYYVVWGTLDDEAIKLLLTHAEATIPKVGKSEPRYCATEGCGYLADQFSPICQLCDARRQNL